MSMKSTTMMPPMSRSRSWRTTSSAASRLFLVTVSSRLPPEPVNLPVLTSTTVIASVRSMTSEPPEGSQTLRSRPLAICSSTRYAANRSVPWWSAGVVALEPLLEVGRHVRDVALDRVPGVLALDHELAEVLGEQVPDDLEGQVGLAVEQLRGAALGLGLDVLPARLEPLDVAGQLVLAGALGGGAHDDARGVGDDLLEERLEPVALGVGQLAGDAAGRAVGDVDQEPAGQRDLAGEPGALVAHRVLGDLDQDGLARGQHRLDLARLALLVAQRGPVDLTGVQHGVAAAADVDERGLHRRQDVLDPAEVDVADQRGLRLAGDVVLDEHLVLEHADLGQVVALADHHDPVDGLAAGQELRLADDRRAAASGLAALAAALLLGLEPGRPGERGDLVLGRARLALPGAPAARAALAHRTRRRRRHRSRSRPRRSCRRRRPGRSHRRPRRACDGVGRRGGAGGGGHRRRARRPRTGRRRRSPPRRRRPGPRPRRGSLFLAAAFFAGAFLAAFLAGFSAASAGVTGVRVGLRRRPSWPRSSWRASSPPSRAP